MPNVSEKDILRRLEMLARVKPDADAAQQAVDRVRMQLLSGALQQAPKQPLVLRIWQRPWAKIAVAAVVVFAVTWGGNQWLQPDHPESEPVAVTGDPPAYSPRNASRWTGCLPRAIIAVWLPCW